MARSSHRFHHCAANDGPIRSDEDVVGEQSIFPLTDMPAEIICRTSGLASGRPDLINRNWIYL
jgi:hypothetical protein